MKLKILQSNIYTDRIYSDNPVADLLIELIDRLSMRPLEFLVKLNQYPVQNITGRIPLYKLYLK
jgi:hypothetical protein